MTEQEYQTPSAVSERSRHGALRRRGLLAGAAALTAGLIAAGKTDMVSANTGNFLKLGDSPTTVPSNPNNYVQEPTVVSYNGVAVGINNVFTIGEGLTSSASSFPAAIAGYAYQSGSAATGLYGASNVASGLGVVGATSSAATNGIGVLGDGTTLNSGATAGTIGVQGIGNTIGVKGISASGTGVYGIISGGSAAGTVAVSGTNNSSAANSHGIVGTAGSGHGLIGNTNFTGGGPPYYAGLVGNAPNGAYAGLFFGKVSITGTLNGHTAIMQQAQIAVTHPDGSHRLSYALSATENWIEDAGKATLANGQATVKIDPAFAALAETNDYNVFLTAHGDYNLHVAEMKADAFVVRVTSAGGSTPPTGGAPVPGSQVAKASNVAGPFSWKVMAKRKDGQGQRLATYTFPNVTPPHIPNPPTK